MSLSSVSVVTNALRLSKVAIPQSFPEAQRPEPAQGASCH
jgi:hypothetical protein